MERKRVRGNQEQPTGDQPSVEQKLLIIPSQPSFDPFENKPRIVKLYGEITEESCSELIDSLYEMKELSKEVEPLELTDVDEEDVKKEEVATKYTPFDLLISTDGGLVSDMFSVYDTMKFLQKEVEIGTFGLGKVSSAGVLLLAAGTKGRRKIGKNCNVMIHEISGGEYGSVKEIKNGTKQIQRLRNQYIDALVENTNMTRSKILHYFRKQVDIYFTAEEALKYGIVDMIV